MNIKDAPIAIDAATIGAIFNFADQAALPKINASSAVTPSAAELPAPVDHPPLAQAMFSGPDWLIKRRDMFDQAKAFLEPLGLTVRVHDRFHPIRRFYVGRGCTPVMLEDVIELAIARGMPVNV